MERIIFHACKIQNWKYTSMVAFLQLNSVANAKKRPLELISDQYIQIAFLKFPRRNLFKNIYSNIHYFTPVANMFNLLSSLKQWLHFTIWNPWSCGRNSKQNKCLRPSINTKASRRFERILKEIGNLTNGSKHAGIRLYLTSLLNTFKRIAPTWLRCYKNGKWNIVKFR